jgi:putative ABC transport system ATP-binding protein
VGETFNRDDYLRRNTMGSINMAVAGTDPGAGLMAKASVGTATSMTAVIRAQAISHAFRDERVIQDVTIDVQPGEVLAITGRSGAGKSTLLHCLGGLLTPTAGDVWLGETNLTRLKEKELSQVRREAFGFVLQFGELIPELTLSENVQLPLRLLKQPRSVVRQRASDMLDRLGVQEFADRRVSEVSGGQAQRVAVARALIHAPKVVFADEPTGALDRKNADVVLQELLLLARENAAAVVIVTHDSDVASMADRRLSMSDGAIELAEANLG